MEIKSAVFVKSSETVEQCPKSPIHEFAFIGRSNVGKSSLINMLTNRNGLAKVSSTPGKTITINHFLINNRWHLVDLPGYGFAKRSKDQREQWKQNMDDYFMKRENLQCVFVLIDSRIDPQKIDLEFIDYLGEKGVPFVLVFTKMDKSSQTEVAKKIAKFKKTMLERWEELPEIFLTSSEKKTGRDKILKFIHNLT
jgi:GTP-binding protein